MLYNFFGLLLIILAGIVRFRIQGDLGVEKKGEGKEEEEKADKTDENKEEKNTDNTDENKEEDKEILIGKQE